MLMPSMPKPACFANRAILTLLSASQEYLVTFKFFIYLFTNNIIYTTNTTYNILTLTIVLTLLTYITYNTNIAYNGDLKIDDITSGTKSTITRGDYRCRWQLKLVLPILTH